MTRARTTCIAFGVALAGCAATPGNSSPGLERELEFATAVDIDAEDAVFVRVPAAPAGPDRDTVRRVLVDVASEFYGCAIAPEEDFGNPIAAGIVNLDIAVGADFDFRAFFRPRDFFEPLDFFRANGVSAVEATAYTTK